MKIKMAIPFQATRTSTVVGELEVEVEASSKEEALILLASSMENNRKYEDDLPSVEADGFQVDWDAYSEDEESGWTKNYIFEADSITVEEVQ